LLGSRKKSSVEMSVALYKHALLLCVALSGCSGGAQATLDLPEPKVSHAFEPYFLHNLKVKRPVKNWNEYTVPFKTTRAERQLVFNRLWVESRKLPVLEELPVGPERSIEKTTERLWRVYMETVPQTWSTTDKVFALYKLSGFWATRNLFYDRDLLKPNNTKPKNIMYTTLVSMEVPSGVCSSFIGLATDAQESLLKRLPEAKGWVMPYVGISLDSKSVSVSPGHAILALRDPEGYYVSLMDITWMQGVLSDKSVRSARRCLRIDPDYEPSWYDQQGGTQTVFEQEVFLARGALDRAAWTFSPPFIRGQGELKDDLKAWLKKYGAERIGNTYEGVPNPLGVLTTLGFAGYEDGKSRLVLSQYIGGRSKTEFWHDPETHRRREAIKDVRHKYFLDVDAFNKTIGLRR